MEKIYMEENQNNQRKRNSRSSASVMMTFVLAFVAIISLVAYGFGQISFAIPDASTGNFPDTMTLSTDTEYAVFGAATDKIYVQLHYANIGGRNKLFYCIEHDKEVASESVYNKTNKITDNGLIYLLSYLINDDYKYTDASGNETEEFVRAWLGQTAIWIYQFNIGADNTTKLTQAQVDNTLKEKTLYLRADGSEEKTKSSGANSFYNTYKVGGKTVKQLLDEAISIHKGTTTWKNSEITLSKKSDIVSVTSDNKYYQSDLITVATDISSNDPFTKFEGYKIDLSKAPEGTYIVDTNNEEIKELDNITQGTQFYVRVPVDKITDENKTVSVQVVGAYTRPVAYVYASGEYQKLAYLSSAVEQQALGLDIPFNYTPDVPDTSITAAQSIYFIGLIILLAGVGIIYANVKPVKAN